MNKLSILAFLPSAPIFLPLWLAFLLPGEITTSQAGAATTGREVVPVNEFFKKLHKILNKQLNMNKLSILAFLPSAPIFLPMWLVFLLPGEITISQTGAATTGKEVVPVSEVLKICTKF
ncbi:MAG TPA: hypothetical protein VG738_24900 [Chitinophagaceae bacterium]|nr:hypothetical protein [Chitinophagaceae bacterium]